MKAILCFLATVIHFGCSATGPVFQEVGLQDSRKSIIYIYRPSTAINSGGYPNIFIDDIDYGPLLNDGYVAVITEPGIKTIILKGDWTKWGLYKPIGIRINAKPGNKHYVRMGNQLDAFVVVPAFMFHSTSIAIQEVAPEFGASDIASTKQIRDLVSIGRP